MRLYLAIVSAAYHQKHIKLKLMEIYKHHFREAPYRRTVFKEVTKMFCPNTDAILISLVNNTTQKGYNTHTLLHYMTAMFFLLP